ncbi:MAG: YdcF family protein [Mariniphaga sp.]
MTSPINWILGSLLLSIYIRKNLLRSLVLWGALILSLIFTNKQLQIEAYRAWSAPYRTAMDTSMVYDLAVVLGGSTDYSKEWNQIDYNEAADRMTEAIRLYRLGRVKKILVSGDQAINIYNGKTYAPYFLNYMEQMGVNRQDIILEQKAMTTRENIFLIKEMILKYDQPKILLITSGWHLRRAMKGFKASGLNLVPYGVDVPSRNDIYSWNDLLPSWMVAVRWHVLIHEMVGMMVIN